MMESTVFDILVYVFDRYMMEELAPDTERDTIARDLTQVGFASSHVEQALDWLSDLADQHDRPELARDTRAFRVFTSDELARLDAPCRGLLLSLENGGILSPGQREIVIDRLLALDAEELNLDQVKWIVMMVLSSQPGQESACERMEEMLHRTPAMIPH